MIPAALSGARIAVAAAALLAGPALGAGELYRWIEPDGSRTFSPTPPVDGTPYTAVDPATLRPIGGEADGGNRAAPAPRLASAQHPATDPVRPRPATERAHRAGGTAEPPGRATTPVGRLGESARCAELRKRVVSLERRLTVPLSDEEMDATVVRMAGYQRSFEDLCL